MSGVEMPYPPIYQSLGLLGPIIYISIERLVPNCPEEALTVAVLPRA